MNERKRFLQLDYGLLLLLACLTALGLAALWSASHGADGHVAGYVFRQMKWIGIGFVALVVCATFDYRFLQSNAWIIYLGLVLMLVAVLLVGKTSMGAQRWLILGPLRVQPSEFMKIGIAIMVAHVYANEPRRPPYGVRQLALPAVLTAIPVVLTLLQPDLGTAILVASVATSITLFQGIRTKPALWSLAGLFASMPAFWMFLKDYQRQRILTFLNPERDPTGAGYHIIQSKIAIGSGQFLGKGHLKGTQAHLRFLPERHTDFIFSVLAEEWGFLGSVVVLTLFALLILWGLDIAARARDTFGRLLAVGVTSILFVHVVVNIGMVMGLLPVVGVPLPLFSYGGSSVLTTCIIAGILLNIRMRRFNR